MVPKLTPGKPLPHHDVEIVAARVRLQTLQLLQDDRSLLAVPQSYAPKYRCKRLASVRAWRPSSLLVSSNTQ